MGTSVLPGGIGVALLLVALVLRLRSPAERTGHVAGLGGGPNAEGSGVPAVPRQPVPTLTAAAEAGPEDGSTASQ